MKFLREYTISTHAPTGWATRGPLGLFAALVAQISTHAPAGGATSVRIAEPAWAILFLLTPLREGRLRRHDGLHRAGMHFYSRPCGRGDFAASISLRSCIISTHAPAGGATGCKPYSFPNWKISTHAPAGGATEVLREKTRWISVFLLTPLREGRRAGRRDGRRREAISTHAPAGGATFPVSSMPLSASISTHAPAGGATSPSGSSTTTTRLFLLTPLREGRPNPHIVTSIATEISTHAPAGGATAIFHKSVMRFCGKLPKDDTVLCLASFGFPRRDPKAVYLAWISCANLPQKCVREGLALKDQGTSCFHEGLASHAFDPVLV